MKRALFDD